MTTKTMKRLFLIGLLILIVPAALADPVPPINLSVGESSRRDLSTLVPLEIDAIAGNVTQLNITAMMITKSWQGYYGNISGRIILQDARNYSLYEWNGSVTSGEVFATRSTSVVWTTINCSNSTVIAQEELALGQTAIDGDSVTNTFTETDHQAFFVGVNNMTGCPTTYTFVNSAAQSVDFPNVLLADGNGTVVYTTIIDHNTTGYNGVTYDFQLLVGENGHGNVDVTPYYFFVELG